MTEKVVIELFRSSTIRFSAPNSFIPRHGADRIVKDQFRNPAIRPPKILGPGLS